MKKYYLPLVAQLLLSVFAYSQVKQGLPELRPLTETELQKLASIPEYQTWEGDNASTLPSIVDNTLQPYFRPLFNQSGLECGQAASIGLNFTYEMDWVRNLPANIPQNQYATHFTYDFINGGSDAGVSYFESWEIIKRCGNPTSYEYGGLAAGGASRWMSGYDKYYNAMHNRISDVYSISSGDEAGLNTLKNWIYNHSNTSSVGGLANIYIQYKTPDAQLAAGTPEAGKWVITTWGGSPNHAVTLVGYNDSIRYDYNNDGQYTNNIDINGDGVVNIKDWEIGGFRIANTYGGINNWGNLGFSYVMYKTFADNLGSGGIWNHAAHIVKVKQDVSPKLTFKITLKHTSRNKLRLKAGVSQNPFATEPDNILNLPVFDLQGGDKYMQGGTTEADKTIEFGIDATPLLSEIAPGQPAKFFLMLAEIDPSATATGSIISFALVDYNGTTTTIPCALSNVPIVENGLTILSIIHTPNHNRPSITNTSLPEAKIYEPFSLQMDATGGTPSYRWKFLCDYSQTALTASFPAITAPQLTISNTSNGFAEVNLPFEFPFYGKKYSKVYAHVDGYLMFQPDLMPWTFIIYEKTFFKNTRNISPYMAKPLILNPSDGDGIRYEGTPNYAIFSWKSSMYGSGPTTDLNYAAKIYPDGKIELYYGNIVSNDWVTWNAGISNGDGINYKFCSITDSLIQPSANSMFRFTTPPFPTEMSLTDEGVFSGTPAAAYSNVPVRFYAEDNNNMYNTKTLTFSTKGINIEYTVSSGGDTIVEYGETALLTAKLTNIGTSALHNVNLKLMISDPYILLIDSTETVGLLNPGQSLTFPAALAFKVSDAVSDGHVINTISQAVATEDVFTRTLPINAYSPNLKISSFSIQDGNNNILMPGESGTLHITIRNEGGSKAVNINTLLTSIDPLLNIVQGSAIIDSILKQGTKSIDLQVTVAPSCPVGHIVMGILQLTADYNYSATDSIYFTVGAIAEDFETANFARYPWHFGGSANWIISTTQPYEGSYCASSPSLLDNQQSSIYVVMNVLCASEISFYRRVSSENNYDFLTFFIDGAEQGKWSGEVPWGKVTVNVSAGQHTFTWRYSKDINTVAGSDKAWVDYILWPPYDDLLLIANAGPDDFVCHPSGYQLQPALVNAESIFWASTGNGYFNNNAIPNALYYPSSDDLANGSVTLTIYASNATAQAVTDNITLDVIQGPTASTGPDASICSGTDFAITSATMTGISMLWTSTGDGIFNNNSTLNTVYSPGPNDIINGEVQLLLTSYGTAQCGNVTDTLQLQIYPAVFADAGADQSVPYGTSTQLFGAANGGTGNLNVNWNPPALLINAGLINPYTVNLTNSQEFTLTVTDPATQCNATDIMFVNVTGSPLVVFLTAEPDRICKGSNSQLSATAGGGSGNYTYSWSSIPAGFTSSSANPVVYPQMTTEYVAEVNDGINIQQATVTVIVDSAKVTPSQPAGSASVNVLLTPFTHYSTLASPGIDNYLWLLSPAEAGYVVQFENNCQLNWSSLFSGTALLSVAGINSCGTSEYSEPLSITASPLIGIQEEPVDEQISLWPNPASDMVYIRTVMQGPIKITLCNSQGKLVKESEFTVTDNILSLDLHQFAPGIYLLSAENKTTSKQLKRIVITN